MTATLADHAIAVTGGFGALGAALGEVLVQAGAHVALIGRGQPPSGLSSAVLASQAALPHLLVRTLIANIWSQVSMAPPSIFSH